LNNLAELLSNSGKPEEARPLLEEAIRHQQAALAANPRHPRYRLFLRNHYAVLAATLLRLGKHDEAAVAAQQLAGTREQHWEDLLWARDLLARCAALAAQDEKLTAQERVKQAAGHAAQARDLLRQAAQQVPDDALAQNDLAWRLATHPDPRLRAPALAVALARKAVAKAKENGTVWNTLGVAEYRAGDPRAAAAALDKSMQLRNGGDSSDWFFLAMAHWQLGDKEQARQFYNRAVQWMEQNAPQNQELRHLRLEAAELMGVKTEVTHDKL
jgi:tetratricopeptide (TPR) repeat protein